MQLIDNGQMEMGLPLYSAQQVRNLDACAIHDCAIDGYTLMQRAAASAWRLLRQHWPAARSVGVLVGPGNNGGDALVLAQLARRDGCAVRVLMLADPARLRGEAGLAWDDFCAAGLTVASPDDDLSGCDVLVDGLLGTGLARDVDPAFGALIARVNASGRPVLALDLPSGISADRGVVMGAAIRADLTISFIGRKQGLYSAAALDFVGQRVFCDLDVPARVYEREAPSAWLLPEHAPLSWLPRRALDSHKGRHGHVLAIGGAPGYSGAIRLCAGAALRSGAGLVSVLTHPRCRAEVAASRPELMVRAVDVDDLAPLAAALQRATVVALGPGLDTREWGRTLIEQLKPVDVPVVFDADALNLMTLQAQWPTHCVITPHPGEAARLLQISTSEVQADRYAAARHLAQATGAVVVLKGAGTLVASAQGEVLVCAQGNPGMACAGMGDVLTGVIAAALAQAPDQSMLRSVAAAVVAHARAGDGVAAKIGQRGMLPSDVIEALPGVLNP